MKNKMIILLAAALLTSALAGNAFAAFEDLNLTRIVYGTTTEVATDLGSVASLIGTTQTLGGGTTSFAAMATGDTALFATYYSADQNNSAFYFSAQSGLKNTIVVNADNAPVSIGNLGGSVNGFYAANGITTNSVDGTKASASARGNSSNFFQTFEQSTPGFGGFAASVQAATIKTDASLTAAATQELYYWDGVSATATDTGESITTNLDGSTTLNVAATPIPPAFFLMGSGLLGMVGLRRKKN
jgi:hypothetical protein